MGYTKKVWQEYQSLKAFDYEIDKRINNKKPFGSGDEKEYIESIQKIRDLLETEDNLAILEAMNEALSKLLLIAKNTWKEEWGGLNGFS